ncbi:3-oxoacyl-[acyl-carrier-protein] synthase II [Pararhodospirillum photometricum DSM 122]|uniref:3-oxoacyl-[acyl-carrier-protein] synthase II n=1 Tax=Pararhodospirillum photometricum DSM 122 TaxID=1150469 RepID=H6SJ26_PARPM|nr:3-oxoacyl-[acyl-carrier-protein] synthase II [Pararhodospirillum photometricum DSM 122]
MVTCWGRRAASRPSSPFLALRNGLVPPTLNLRDPSDGCDIDLAPLTAKERPIRYAVSNSFGFGGTNASLVFTGAP